MKNITESLRANDLAHMIKNVFEIDSFKSKIGDDKNIVVLSFTVEYQDPATDLENFIEMGYNFVLDADVSPGETDDGTYRVYVELERNRHVAGQIRELLDGIEKLAGVTGMRFRYFKSFKSQLASEENLTAAIPVDPESYDIATQEMQMENFSNFFSNSYADSVEVMGESIAFKRIWKDTVTFNIVTSGPKKEVYSNIKGPIMLESKDIAEVMFLSKFIGNFNITKINKTFVFENNNWAVALEKKA